MDNRQGNDATPFGAPWRSDAEFQEAVRAALHPLSAPEGFATRVMERATRLEEEKKAEKIAMPARFSVQPDSRFNVSRFRGAGWRLAYASVAAIAFLTAGGVHLQHVREQRRVDAAAAQFNEAMQVTDHALDRVAAQLEQGKLGKILDRDMPSETTAWRER